MVRGAGTRCSPPPGALCACTSSTSGAGLGPQAASGAVPCFAGVSLEDGGTGRGGAGRGGSESGPWPRVALSRSSRLAEGEGGGRGGGGALLLEEKALSS